MKRPEVILLCLYLFLSNISCGQNTTNQKQAESGDAIKFNGKSYILKKGIAIPQNQQNKTMDYKIIFHELRDPERNMVMAYLPIPNDWDIKEQSGNDGIVATGPNNIKIYGQSEFMFTYSQLPGFNEMILQQGGKVQPLKSIEQLVKEDFNSLFEKEGFRLARQYPLPKQKAYDENYEQFVFKPVPMQKTFDAMATEWEDNNGNIKLLVIRQFVTYTNEACYWGYRLNGLEALKSNFETAKNNYLYALANSKFNPQWLQTCYYEDMQTSARLKRIHEGRMAELRAEGQRIIARGNEHSAMVDRNHKKFMDTHLEREYVSNASSGKTYQVDAGSKVYWINSNGEYIPTDNVNFDPNLDPNLNGETWTKGTNNN
ncbi:hypothetical protein [Cellulophaga tyrosinoxydans]|uniref:Uncharacterized protein n=1 Tax=Cellulophaga tyrosinoxydans TaxID=504486 RepID=A0A1W1YZL9_9FLAO|nr:hypothetical protein [Cellulophaga tyrosinoxydans]SMC41640.1 hypothetical protein SAMN05660703_1005 [Cellulophaga tyrosinoxydans]